MSILKDLSKKLQKEIKEAGYEIKNFNLLPSNRKDLGDYQINDAMQLAKTYHKNPREIAEDIVKVLEQDKRLTNINIAGPGFINVTLSDEFLVDSLNKMANKKELMLDKKEKKKIIIDYGGANVAKALHVGHLRSANIGEALKRLAKAFGYEVLGDAHLGDYGRPLGFVVLEMKKRYPDLPYFDKSYEGDFSEIELPITNSDLEEIYPYASQRAKEDENYLEEGRDITTKIQHHERGYYDLWKKIVEISKKDIKEVYDKLNVSFELWLGESDAVEYLDELLEKFNKKNLIKESEGAKIIEVKEEDETKPMPPLLLIKSNDSVSYETTDLATILQREIEYQPDEVWYVVDKRQALHFEQVFRASKLAELTKAKLQHIGFGTMNGKDGKPFKTRDGGVMQLKDLIDLIIEETTKKIENEAIQGKEKEKVAEQVAIAALKYADLIPTVGTDYIFEIEKFADMEGKTGPYILYSTIRMKSLLEKAKDFSSSKAHTLGNGNEKEMIEILLSLPETLEKALQDKSLNEITDYLFRLTSEYNKFYQENRILTEENEKLRESWIILTKTIYQVNQMLLDILGIKLPEKM